MKGSVKKSKYQNRSMKEVISTATKVWNEIDDEYMCRQAKHTHLVEKKQLKELRTKNKAIGLIEDIRFLGDCDDENVEGASYSSKKRRAVSKAQVASESKRTRLSSSSDIDSNKLVSQCIILYICAVSFALVFSYYYAMWEV